VSSTPRGSVPGTSLAVAVCVVVGVAAGAAALGPLSHVDGGAAALSLSVHGDTLAFGHRGGPTLAVADLRLVVRVDGTPLRHQPPVPFFAARGFRAGPTGPFNSASDGRWSPGERASLTLASTNSPAIEPGDTVTVRAVVDGRTVATVTARARTGVG
jgi:hypothetical protein